MKKPGVENLESGPFKQDIFTNFRGSSHTKRKQSSQKCETFLLLLYVGDALWPP
jgi:hypothetical protein